MTDLLQGFRVTATSDSGSRVDIEQNSTQTPPDVAGSRLIICGQASDRRPAAHGPLFLEGYYDADPRVMAGYLLEGVGLQRRSRLADERQRGEINTLLATKSGGFNH